MNVRHLCVLGLQWGDEGKGKIVDVLTENVDAVVRYQGGANAGHTIIIGDVERVLHHLPSGVLRDGVDAVLGGGMVIEGEALLAEIDALPSDTIDRIYLSDRAHLVLPYHKAIDRERESCKDGTKIGTTLRGIGPTYEDKFGRRGVRLADLATPGFISDELPARLRARAFDDGLIESSLEQCLQLRERLGHRIVATEQLLHEWHDRGKRLLFEGAQGSLLDIDFGTYPFVTSSSPSFVGIGSGCGFSPRKIDHVVGVTKAYSTRVGEGPFPTELHGADAEPIREKGGEYGATTGRPRRCGWLDLPALRFSCQINDVDSLSVTKSDILAGRDTVPVAVAYRQGGKLLGHFPASAAALAAVEPVYEDWPGWSAATPEAMAPFIERLERAVGVSVSILSTGRRRDEVVILDPDLQNTGA